jgi:DNA-binding response OmpR family regulator
LRIYGFGVEKLSTEHGILLVIDDDGLLKILQSQIEKAGYRVVTATNVVDAIRSFQEFKPDLILAWTSLLNDQQLYKKVRSLPGGEKVPFIIMHYSPHDEEVLSNLRKQRAQIISFPFHLKEVLHVIQSCIADTYPKR